MNTRSLKHFLALAEHLHFGAASEICNISLSALSRNIRQLEAEIGVLLFHRDNRSVVLTPAGQRFQQYARETLNQWQLIRHELSNKSDQLQGELRLYCSVTASYSILFDLLNRLRPDYPKIEIKLRTGDPEQALQRILSGEEEISIAASPANLPRGVIFKPITISPLLFIAPIVQLDPAVPRYPPVSRAEWASVPMILSEVGIARHQVDAWFRECGITPQVYAQVEGYEAIVSMVSLGFGVGVVPKIVLDNSPLVERIQVLPVEPTLKPFKVGLFTLKKHLNNPLVRVFWELVEAS